MKLSFLPQLMNLWETMMLAALGEQRQIDEQQSLGTKVGDKCDRDHRMACPRTTEQHALHD
jgi:hypothetical protein